MMEYSGEPHAKLFPALSVRGRLYFPRASLFGDPRCLRDAVVLKESDNVLLVVILEQSSS